MRLTDVSDPLSDTQSARDERRLAIQRVGVKALRYPLALRVGSAVQTPAAEWTLDVALPAERKGTHMSRFVAWLERQGETPMDAARLHSELAAMLDLLDAQEGRIEARFTFFVRKTAPVSGLSSLLDYRGAWVAEQRGGEAALWAEVGVPVKSLCPCSKEISEVGAHNQRSLVTLRVRMQPDAPIAWHELVRYAEGAASSEVWPMLKRADEKWITEAAYHNPKFVEDLARDAALALQADPRVGAYRVEVENFESIHNHSAFACISRD